jgi:phenylpyruvate tautomerase PptA (4-oxalocrotonate tautomerase family)
VFLIFVTGECIARASYFCILSTSDWREPSCTNIWRRLNWFSVFGKVLKLTGVFMPLITLTIRKGKSSSFKSAVLAAVHQALVSSGVPEADRFHRVLELDADDFRFDVHYPDLTSPRDNDFVLIEILLSVGRSVKIKKKILADLIAHAEKDPGLNPENIMVVFKETSWENWSFAGGRQIHV